jgi:hypothetical protein
LNWDNNWKIFASEIWPLYSVDNIGSYFENGKTEAILAKWGRKNTTTSQLLQVLVKMERYDIIIYFEEKYFSIK